MPNPAVGGLVGLNRLAVNALSEPQLGYMRISYGRERGSGYNAQGSQKGLKATKKRFLNAMIVHLLCFTSVDAIFKQT